MARFEAAGKKLSAEEKAKRDEHPFDAYARFKAESEEGRFPKGIDNFRWRFHGLFYVAPTQWDGLIEIPIIGRLLTMTVWANGEGETLPDQTGFVPGEGPTVFVSTGIGEAAHWRPGVYAERNYYAPLDQLLQSDSRVSADLLQNVVQRALGHLTQGKSAKTMSAA